MHLRHSSRPPPPPIHRIPTTRTPRGPQSLWQQVPPHSEHLGSDGRGEAVHLLAVLLHLPRVEHALEPAGFLRQLEQPLPLVLGQGLLFGCQTRSIFRLPLRLPLCNLELLASQLALVILVVVEVRVVGFDALEQQIASLLEEGINREVQGVEGWVRGQLGLVAPDVVEGGREGNLRGLGGRRNLVQEGSEEVRVMNQDRDLDDDVPEGQLGFLQAFCNSSQHYVDGGAGELDACADLSVVNFPSL